VEAALDTGARLRLEELENLSAVAAVSFKVKYSLVFFKSAARAVVKVGASAAAQTAASKHGNDLAGLLAGLLGQGYALASERADTRCARYFPGIAYVTGVTLEPGTYVVRVNYYSGDRIADSVEKTITALPDRANIIEAVSFN
jgi:hypothetical protein